jgi:ribosome maturation factor RimP
VGREVTITTTGAVDGQTKHRGVLESADEHQVTVRIEEDVRTIPYESIGKARTVFRWERSPKPGRK